MEIPISALLDYIHSRVTKREYYKISELIRGGKLSDPSWDGVLTNDIALAVQRLGRTIELDGAVMHSPVLNRLTDLADAQGRLRADAERRATAARKAEEHRQACFRKQQEDFVAQAARATAQSANEGTVYVLTNRSMPGLVKIGWTRGTAKDRAAGLSSTSVPDPFEVAFECLSEEPEKLEKRVHRKLRAARLNKKREFFELPLSAVRAVIEEECAAIRKKG